MASIAISMTIGLATLILLALIGVMFSRRWSQFCGALRNQPIMRPAPMCPPAETNIVMLRPANRAGLSRPVPLALAA